MPVTKTAYEKFSLWTKATGRETKCLISAHGGPNGSKFDPNGARVMFYVHMGQAYVGGSGLALSTAAGAAGGMKITGTYTSHCPDYSLSKLQEYHAASTMFPWVNKMRHYFKAGGLQVDESNAQVAGMVDYGAGVSGPMAPGAAMPVGSVDFVTVRYRPGHLHSCKLSDIVTTLRGLGYNEFHCAFCR